MSTDTSYDAVAGPDFLAARVVLAPSPLLLVALKHWREIRKRIEEEIVSTRSYAIEYVAVYTGGYRPEAHFGLKAY